MLKMAHLAPKWHWALKKYAKTASNQNIPESKVVLLSKYDYFNTEEKIFSDIFGLIWSKNGIDCLEKYPKTASNQKVYEAKVSLNAKKTLIPESQVAN